MLTAARDKFGVRQGCDCRGLASRCHVKRRTHAVQRSDKAGIAIAPTNTFSGKAVNLREGPRDEDIVVTACQFQCSRTVIFKILTISLVKDKYAIARQPSMQPRDFAIVAIGARRIVGVGHKNHPRLVSHQRQQGIDISAIILVRRDNDIGRRFARCNVIN